MSTSLNALIPELQPYAKDFVDELGRLGLGPRITSTLRTRAEQTRLYRRFLAGQQPYYVAPPGTSPHEYGFAFDLVCQDLEYAGELWLSWGGEWGGRSTRGHGYDPVHFQYPGFTGAVAHSVSAGEAPQFLDEKLLQAISYVDPYFGLGSAALQLQFLGPKLLAEYLGSLFR